MLNMSFCHRYISLKGIGMTSQISFGTKEMGLAVKKDRGNLKLKALRVTCLPPLDWDRIS